jgi:signal-transduction protein with cAMP-binding, CBS, and nucleotidyltransferase domain
MRDLTGCSEHELDTMDFCDLLAPGVKVNQIAAAHFEKLGKGLSASAEFEAVLQAKTGQTKDVWVTIARIFFSEKPGHVIHFTPLSRSQEETLHDFHLPPTSPAISSDDLNQRIRESESSGEVIRLLGDFPLRLRVLIDQGIRTELLRHIVGSTFDTVVNRLAQLASPPATPSFALLSLGSAARHEMTLFSDQDSALIFDDVSETELVQVRRSMLRFGDELCGRLKQAGWAYCPGGIMAANPKWCLSLSEWKQNFNRWIIHATPQSILEVNVFLDIRCAYGDKGLVEKLKEHVHSLARKNPEFLSHYARNCLLYKAPLTLFGQLKTTHSDGHKTIDIKGSLKPVEIFARIYALKYGLPDVGTIERVQQLQNQGVLQEQSAREICYILEYLWHLRFHNQLITEDGLPSVNDEVDIVRLTEIERQTLKSALSQIATIQSKLSYDFFGVDAH